MQQNTIQIAKIYLGIAAVLLLMKFCSTKTMTEDFLENFEKLLQKKISRSYTFTLSDGSLAQIDNIQPLISYSNRSIEIQENEYIFYSNFSFYFFYNLLSKKKKFSEFTLIRQNLMATTNLESFSLNKQIDNSYTFSRPLYEKTTLNFEDISRYKSFETFLKENENSFLTVFNTILEELFDNSLNQLSPGIAVKNFYSFAFYIENLGFTFLNCCKPQGIIQGSVQKITFKDMKKIGERFGEFYQVSMIVRYVIYSDIFQSFVSIEKMIFENGELQLENISCYDKNSIEIVEELFRRYKYRYYSWEQ